MQPSVARPGIRLRLVQSSHLVCPESAIAFSRERQQREASTSGWSKRSKRPRGAAASEEPAERSGWPRPAFPGPLTELGVLGVDAVSEVPESRNALKAP